jgi:hypothetical protein
VVNAPGDRASYGEFNDYGIWGPGEWAGQLQPRGYWVYVAPNWYIWKTSSAAANVAASDDSDDGDDASPRHSKRGGAAAPATGTGTGQGPNRDLACAAAKLLATQNAGCTQILSAVGGAACDCNAVTRNFWSCTTQVTCR